MGRHLKLNAGVSLSLSLSPSLTPATAHVGDRRDVPRAGCPEALGQLLLRRLIGLVPPRVATFSRARTLGGRGRWRMGKGSI